MEIARYFVFTRCVVVKNSKARNLNSDASNLNFMARSFYEMPTNFFALRGMVFQARLPSCEKDTKNPRCTKQRGFSMLWL